MNDIRLAPALFVGHGSPMNAIENNEYSRKWSDIATLFPKPQVILAVSAHWFVPHTRLNDQNTPSMIYDMVGFPEDLYRVKYPLRGNPALAHRLLGLVGNGASIDNQWGIDHGTWSVLRRMYPEADIPVVQMSIDRNVGAERHFEIGKILKSLRREGVMIFGSGNVVHNLSLIDGNRPGGFPWADEFDRYVSDHVRRRDFEAVVEYRRAGPSAKVAFFTPEHFFPLLYVLGSVEDEDDLMVFNETRMMGSMSMTGFLFSPKNG